MQGCDMRLLDIIIALVALLLLMPILLPIMVLQKFLGEGEIFYVQSRIGRDEKPFGLIKFATMLKNSPEVGAGDITLKNDPRVLPHGKFLRKSKINELPQLFNVLLGDMSIVGPRPLTSKNYYYYDKQSRSIISSVPPGLTGVGSIVFRDEEQLMLDVDDPIAFYKHNISPYKAELEKYYYKHRSLKQYLIIIALTIIVVVRPRTDISRFFKDLPLMPKELKRLKGSK